MGRLERGDLSHFNITDEARRIVRTAHWDICDTMQLRFFLSCLLASWVLFGSSAPASIAPHGYTRPSEPAALKAEDPSQRLINDPSKEPSSFGDKPEDKVKDSKPTSLERARTALAESNAPALSDHEICTTLIKVAQDNELPIGFFTNLIWRESNFDHVAISSAGAMGIAQFMPDVADRLGLDAFDARDALPASARLLRTLRARFGNLGLMAAAYNAGPKRVSDWLEQRSTLPKETRDYVTFITGRTAEHWRVAKPQAVAFNVPRHVPCHRSAAFSEVEQAEKAAQLRKIAEEKKFADQARETERRLNRGKAGKASIAGSARLDRGSCKNLPHRPRLCSERAASKVQRQRLVLVRS
jgi:hypothetical protein